MISKEIETKEEFSTTVQGGEGAVAQTVKRTTCKKTPDLNQRNLGSKPHDGNRRRRPIQLLLFRRRNEWNKLAEKTEQSTDGAGGDRSQAVRERESRVEGTAGGER